MILAQLTEQIAETKRTLAAAEDAQRRLTSAHTDMLYEEAEAIKVARDLNKIEQQSRGVGGWLRRTVSGQDPAKQLTAQREQAQREREEAQAAQQEFAELRAQVAPGQIETLRQTLANARADKRALLEAMEHPVLAEVAEAEAARDKAAAELAQLQPYWDAVKRGRGALMAAESALNSAHDANLRDMRSEGLREIGAEAQRRVSLQAAESELAQARIALAALGRVANSPSSPATASLLSGLFGDEGRAHQRISSLQGQVSSLRGPLMEAYARVEAQRVAAQAAEQQAATRVHTLLDEA